METQNEMIQRFQSIFENMDINRIFEIEDEDDDQQAITGRIIGTHLDNATGDHITVHAVTRGYQEMVLFVESFNNLGTDGESPFRDGLFNVASMLSVIYNNADQLKDNTDFKPYMFFFMGVSRGVGVQYHEPDDYGIQGSITGNNEFQYGYFPNQPETTVVIKNETPHPEYGFSQAELPITVLFNMMMAIETT
jgi:hypothetical protein